MSQQPVSITRYAVLAADQIWQHSIEIKRSEFIGYATRVCGEDAARTFLANIKAEHREARHVCHAFICGPMRDIQRSSDDGEPAGTAGMPILNALLQRNVSKESGWLSDIAVAVVRYFGGIKLGAGGLVQAYSQTAVETLDKAKFACRQRMRLYQLPASFADASRLETSLRAQGYPLRPSEYDSIGVTINLAIPDSDAEFANLQGKLAEWTAGAAQLLPCGFDWVDSPIT